MDEQLLIQLWPEERWTDGAWPAQSRLQLYPPLERPRHLRLPVVLIIPGGGYGLNAPEEGVPVAQFLASRGVYAALLYYRVSPHLFPAPLADACRAVRLVRALADPFGIDPERVTALGFSAGGHLASLLATRPDLHCEPHDDLADRIHARPDRLVLVYPVISLERRAHAPSVRNLLGPEPGPEVLAALSTHRHVDERTPPTLLVHAADDEVVPVQHSLEFAAACAERGVRFQVLIRPAGGHGFVLAQGQGRLATWTETLMEWLEE